MSAMLTLREAPSSCSIAIGAALVATSMLRPHAELAAPFPWREGRREAAVPVVTFDHRSPHACAELIGVMSWPTDEVRRRQWLATYGARLLAQIEGDTRPFQAELRVRWSANIFQPAGGLATLLDAPTQSTLLGGLAEAATSGALQAGLALLALACLKEHEPTATWSLNRAFAAVEAYSIAIRDCGRELPNASERAQKAGWKRWRTVSHLWAAYVLFCFASRAVDYQPSAPGFFDPVGRYLIFGSSGWFFDFATGFSAPRSRGCLVSGEDMLRLETGVDAQKPLLPKLPQVMRDGARAYHVKAIRQD